MIQASDIFSSQPDSSRSPCDEKAVERAFWQSTPTALEKLKQRTDDDCHQAVSKDQDGPDDPLSLSADQTRLIRQTWASTAGIVRNSNGERKSSRPKYRTRRGETAVPDSTNTASASASPVLSTDKSIFFLRSKNIEKVCKKVDERMQKRKVQNRLLTKMSSTTMRLRDEEELKKNMKPHVHGERSHRTDNADTAQVDDTSNNINHDNPRLGLGAPPLDRESESMEEVVPTSQSQERYLSLSQMDLDPIGSFDALCAPISRNDVDVPVISVKSSGPV